MNCNQNDDIGNIVKHKIPKMHHSGIKNTIKQGIRDGFDKDDKISIDRLSTYFISVVLCIKHRGCDESAGIDIFRDNMRNFINMSCGVIRQRAESWRTLSDDLEIVAFLIRHGEKSFFCEHHRRLVNAIGLCGPSLRFRNIETAIMLLSDIVGMSSFFNLVSSACTTGEKS